MPNKPRKPRVLRKLAKGTRKSDYDPAVIAEYDRHMARVRKERHRIRRKHAGYADVTFALSREAREALARRAATTGETRGAYLNRLILETTP